MLNTNPRKYGEIQCGANLSIPVKVQLENGAPIDLTGMTAAFTLKKVKSDYVRDDERAIVKVELPVQDPTEGQFWILASSEDMWIDPGTYYFDIELISSTGAISRLCTLECTVTGGPTNRTINSSTDYITANDSILVIGMASTTPIVNVVAPFVPAQSLTFTTIPETVQYYAGFEVKNPQGNVVYSFRP